MSSSDLGFNAHGLEPDADCTDRLRRAPISSCLEFSVSLFKCAQAQQMQSVRCPGADVAEFRKNLRSGNSNIKICLQLASNARPATSGPILRCRNAARRSSVLLPQHSVLQITIAALLAASTQRRLALHNSLCALSTDSMDVPHLVMRSSSRPEDLCGMGCGQHPAAATIPDAHQRCPVAGRWEGTA